MKWGTFAMVTNRFQQKIYKHAQLLRLTSRQEAQHYGRA